MPVIPRRRRSILAAGGYLLTCACVLTSVAASAADAFAPHTTRAVPVPPSFLKTSRTIAIKNEPRAPLPHQHPRRRRRWFLRRLLASPDYDKDALFDVKTTAALVAAQSSLVAVGAGAAALLGTPNLGFGSGIDFSPSALLLGTLFALPLGALAASLELIEDRYPALQLLTKTVQRSVLSLMGGTFKPAFAFAVSIALGVAAGMGEELLFRGVFQTEVASRLGSTISGVVTSSVVFGLLHAVTPLYAFIATIVSFYFGAIYLFSGNLAVPIVCHAVYDIGALFYAHWTVSQLPISELKDLALWDGPKSKTKSK